MDEQDVLQGWNGMTHAAAAATILPCCGSAAWARGLAEKRPVRTHEALLRLARELWRALTPEDWQEAFRSHPRIGERHAQAATAQSLAWSDTEQTAALAGEAFERAQLAEANRVYEARFGRVFLICASGRSASEILGELHRRLANDDATELLEAAGQQEQITALRLRRWLEGR